MSYHQEDVTWLIPSTKCVSYIEPPHVPILSHHAQYRGQAMAQHRTRWDTNINRHCVKSQSNGTEKLSQNTRKMDIETSKTNHFPMAAVVTTLEHLYWEWKETRNEGKIKKYVRFLLSSWLTPALVVREGNLLQAFKCCLLWSAIPHGKPYRGGGPI